MKNIMGNDTPATRLKILVIGATGGTGRKIVSQALAQGHEVTAYVRSAERGQQLAGANIIVADVLDESALRAAVKNQDAVISALGTPVSPFRQVTLLSTATQAIINAMNAEGVSRLICITGIGAGNSVGHGGFVFDKLIYPLLLRNVYMDKNRQEAVIRKSGLDWTLVRPAVLNDKTDENSIRAITDLSGFHGGTISREKVATFVLDQLGTDIWLHKSPLLSW